MEVSLSSNACLFENCRQEFIWHETAAGVTWFDMGNGCMTGHRKLVRHYHEPGDLHELTFSCDRRMPLLTNDVWRELLCRSIDRAVERWAYDRNLFTERVVMAAIDYIHENPVRRGLSRTATDWKWSSARWYMSDAKLVDPDLPTIHGLPWDFFQCQ